MTQRIADIAHYRGSTMFFALLVSACSFSCSDSSKSSDAMHFGNVALLPQDDAPPDVAPNTELIHLESETRTALCGWIESLDRPSYDECKEEHESHIHIQAVQQFCVSTTESRGVTECHATVEELIGCSVDSAQCDTRLEEPRRCAVLLDEECSFEVFPSAPEG